MASVDETVRELNAQRLKIWERGKEILDNALREGRTLNAEESENYDRVNDDIVRLDKTRDALVSSERAAQEYEQVTEEFRRVSTPIEREDHARRDQNAEELFLRRGVGGEHDGPMKGMMIDFGPAARAYDAIRAGYRGNELRAVFAGDTGASGGSLTIPTSVASSIYSYMTAGVAMRRIGATILTTNEGNPLVLPKTVTHSAGTQIANQDTAFTQSVSVVGSMTLNAYDFGDLIPVSSDVLEDSGVNVIDYVGAQIGRALAQVTATAYIAGSGSSTVQGIQGAITSGSGAGTISSGGSLFGLPAGQELEKLIDVQFNVADSYRNQGRTAWLMRDLTGARVRKIRDGAGGTAGQFVWQPSPTVGAIGGQPDTFLGDPVYFDVNVASMASNAKIVFYGDFSSYHIRDVRGVRLDRSDHLYFDKNQIAFRGLLRTDGDVLDNFALTCLTQNV
jgi:HK97 family phage major capsid protein